MSNIEKIFDFLKIASDLKTTLRWVTFPGGRKESSADHSWSLALLAFLLIDEYDLELDTNKVMKMCLVHDLPECITGDIDSYTVERGEVSKEEKRRGEEKAIEELGKKLPKNHGTEISGLWYEYEEQKTKEAKFVKALDKIETMHQIAKGGYKFFDEALDHMGLYGNKEVKNYPKLKKALMIIKKDLKKEYIKGGHSWKKEYEDL